MSAPIIGTKTFSVPNPAGANPYIFPHTQNTGADRGIFISFAHGNGVSITGVTYGGQAMTAVRNVLYSGISQYLSSWYLADPPIGSNNFAISFSGPLFTGLSIAAYSLTGCGGIGDSVADTGIGNPNDMNVSCSSDSLIFVRAQAFQTASYINIDGVNYAYPTALDIASHNTNSQAWAKLGTNSVAAGVRVAEADAQSGGCYAQSVEILGISAGPPTVDATDDATNISTATFDSGGNVASDGGAALTEVGVCFQNTPNPTTSDWKAVVGSPSVGAFSVTNIPYAVVIPGAGVTVYYRAYAINSQGIDYGPEKSFVSPSQEKFGHIHYVGRGANCGVGVGIC